jgi:hypothetical protein
MFDTREIHCTLEEWVVSNESDILRLWKLKRAKKERRLSRGCHFNSEADHVHPQRGLVEASSSASLADDFIVCHQLWLIIILH